MVIENIKKSENILVVSHAQPDGDAVGSSLALGKALIKMGKKVTIYNEGQIPAIFRFLPSVDLFVNDIESFDDYDTVVILDCGDICRVGEIVDEVEKIPVVINIDHHGTNTQFGISRVIDSTACSTAEIVYKIINDLGVEFDETMAYGIYTGILTDTGSFLFQNTNAAAFAISAEMVNYGVDPYTVAQYVYAAYSLGRLKLLNMVLTTVEISENGKLSTMFLSQGMLGETGTQLEDVYGLVNYAKHIEDVQVAALIRETSITSHGKGSYHVSLRSSGDVDVAEIARAKGGGGHHSAAGYKAESVALSELKRQISEIAENV